MTVFFSPLEWLVLESWICKHPPGLDQGVRVAGPIFLRFILLAVALLGGKNLFQIKLASLEMIQDDQSILCMSMILFQSTRQDVYELHPCH